MSAPCTPKPKLCLYAQAQTLIDRRKARGLRYPLALIVTVAVLAKLAGYSRVEEVADWAKLRAQELQSLFATKRAQMPHHTSWSRILGRAVDVAALERLAQQIVTPPTLVGEFPDRCSIEVALDGKTIRGTIPGGQTRGVHLLAAYEEEYVSAGWSAPPVDFTLARSVGGARADRRTRAASQ